MLRPVTRDDVVKEFEQLADEFLGALALPAGERR
jgi:hypothetical protein